MMVSNIKQLLYKRIVNVLKVMCNNDRKKKEMKKQGIHKREEMTCYNMVTTIAVITIKNKIWKNKYRAENASKSWLLMSSLLSRKPSIPKLLAMASLVLLLFIFKLLLSFVLFLLLMVVSCVVEVLLYKWKDHQLYGIINVSRRTII